MSTEHHMRMTDSVKWFCTELVVQLWPTVDRFHAAVVSRTRQKVTRIYVHEPHAGTLGSIISETTLTGSHSFHLIYKWRQHLANMKPTDRLFFV